MAHSVQIYAKEGLVCVDNLANSNGSIKIQISNKNNLTKITTTITDKSDPTDVKGYVNLTTFGSLELQLYVGNPEGRASSEVITYENESNVDISPNGVYDLESYIIGLFS